MNFRIGQQHGWIVAFRRLPDGRHAVACLERSGVPTLSVAQRVLAGERVEGLSRAEVDAALLFEAGIAQGVAARTYVADGLRVALRERCDALLAAVWRVAPKEST